MLAELLSIVDNEEDSVSANTLDIVIMPPTNACDVLTDEDSGDEDNVIMKNLPASQLRAEAELFEPIIEEIEEHTQEDEEWEHEDLIPLSERRDSLQEINHFTEVRNTKYKWTKEDLDNSRFDVEWPTFSSVSKNVSPVLLLENFIDEEIIEMFVSCTNNYAASKHRKADVTAEEFKVFLGILLLSGYVSVPRHRMFWGNYKDSHNNMVFQSMSRNRFEHILTNVHCCDNNNLDKKGQIPKG
ncbi:transposase is4 [Holotrichia oblita]|uniref:Transposase is4 n=1 Tax=Holotrichia oblita TaxID=644536 RepID=A0ACB9TEA2_HOLOL|nr:transposase is4 [Holotrichia oblita]